MATPRNEYGSAPQRAGDLIILPQGYSHHQAAEEAAKEEDEDDDEGEDEGGGDGDGEQMAPPLREL